MPSGATVLLSLDISAAFDTHDHSVLIDGITREFGIVGSVLCSAGCGPFPSVARSKSACVRRLCVSQLVVCPVYCNTACLTHCCSLSICRRSATVSQPTTCTDNSMLTTPSCTSPFDRVPVGRYT